MQPTKVYERKEKRWSPRPRREWLEGRNEKAGRAGQGTGQEPRVKRKRRRQGHTTELDLRDTRT